MIQFRLIAATLVSLGLLGAAPVRADAGGSAAKLRELDIMLMVTSLGCRHGESDFAADYAAFSSAHHAELNAAAASLRAGLVAESGASGADRALDRISTRIANRYGPGHPWLSCGQLKQVAQGLARAQGPEPLLSAADEVLGNGPNRQLALVHH